MTISAMMEGVKLRFEDIDELRNFLDYMKGRKELILSANSEYVRIKPEEVKIDVWIFGKLIKREPLR